MPMKVHPSSAGDLAAAQIGQGAAALASVVAPAKASAAHASAAKASSHHKASHHPLFASVLAQAAPAPKVSTTDVAPSAVTPRAGETFTPMAGGAYAAISGGARDGMYINTTNNSRRGMAFVLVYKNGREYHIYGTGKDRLVVALRKPTDPPRPAAGNTASGTGGATPTVSAS
jgi:hypothetical protein